MKKRFLSLTMLIALAMTTLLAACGSNDVPANAIVDTPAPTISPTPTPESSSPEVDDKEDGIVDSGTLDEIPDANEEGNEGFSLGEYSEEGVLTNFTIDLKEKGLKSEAWISKHIFLNNPKYAFYIGYFKNGTPSADEMSFTMVAPDGIGETYGLSSDEYTFRLSDANDESYRLYMWYGGKLTDESEFMRNFSQDEIMSAANLPYDASTFQIIEDDNTYKVIFQVTNNFNGKNYIGYECWIEYFDTMDWYEFEYFTEESIFDETEALAIVNSIVRVNIDDFGIIVEE